MEEQHPVPQDITGFKFKLVGDMTLKQFGELAFGVIMAYLFYASNWHPFLKWPLVMLFGFLGVALAFLPIEERPLDVWILNFLRAIYRPTYYVWTKDTSGAITAAAIKPPQVLPRPVAEPEPVPALQPWPVAPKPELPKEPPKPPMPLPSPVAPQPSPLSVEELQKLREQKLTELASAKQKLQTKTEEVKTETYKAEHAANIVTVDSLAQMREKNAPPASPEGAQLDQLIAENGELLKQIGEVQGKIATLSGPDKDLLQTQLTALTKQKDNLSQAIVALRKQIEAKPPVPPPATPTVEPPWAIGATGQMRIVDKPVKARPTISLTSIPNIINGTVFDQRGGPLEGVVMVIKDKAGNSVRALKTNRIGQFIVSTPLPDGTYFLEFEMPGYAFNVYEISLNGEIIKPLEIRGKFIK